MRKDIAGLLAKSCAVAAVALSMTSARAAIIDFRYSGDLVASLTTTGGTDFSLNFVYAPAAAGVAKINDLLMVGPTRTASMIFSYTGTEAPTASFRAGGYEGGPFNWKISYPTSGSSGTNRFEEGETSTFRIASTSPGDWDFSRLHINAFLAGDSIKLTGCVRGDPSCEPSKVPEPGVLALLGVGLAALAGATRRRRR